MQIKQDPITKLYCREDGAVLLPPSGTKFKTFRWAFGSRASGGYRVVGYCHKYYLAHQIVCRAFNGLPPIDKPEVDHINRIKDDNRPSNLHWVDRGENEDNKDCVDQAFEKYGVRRCDDPKAYAKAYNAAHREEINAYLKAHREAHREEHRAYDAAHRAKMKAQGLTHRKGPDGKWGWYPRVAPVKEAAPCL